LLALEHLREAELPLNNAMPQAPSQQKSAAFARGQLVPKLMRRFGCSQRNALRLVRMSASTHLYPSMAREATAF
jgi:hypothetical protein